MYEVKLRVFRDCMGAELYPSAQLQFTNGSISFTMMLTPDAGQEISQLCASDLPNSHCNGGTLPGMQQYTFTANVPLAPSTEWKIQYTEVYRNESINNLFNPGMWANHIYATLNTALAPCNSSPQFTNVPIPYVCLGQPVVYSYGVYDPDADSLSYALVGARGANGTLLPYWSQYSGSQPITGIVLDPLTGEVSFTPNQTGKWVVVMRVNEYNSAGQLIGSVIRDMQFVVYACPNISPNVDDGMIQDLTGATVQTGPRSIQLCPGGSFCFDMTIGDPNAGDVLTATSNIQQNLPGATFSFSGTNPITCSVCWDVTSAVNGIFPFIVAVNDNACPIPAIQTYVYSVNVIEWLQMTMSVVDESCQGMIDGTATANVGAGAQPFTYAWSNGATGPTITAGGGTYWLIVSDANGCESRETSATIGTTMPSQVNAGPDQTVCSGASSVALSGSVSPGATGTWSGGGGSFTVAWPNVVYQPGGNDLANGEATLTLTATGAGGCPPATDQMTITFDDGLSGLTIQVTPSACASTNTATAAIVPVQAGVTYLWSDPNAQTTSTATGLSPGPISAVVTAANGCSMVMSSTIADPQPLAITSMETTDETCVGIGSGTITPIIEGGTPPYEYAWDTGSIESTLVASAGNYSVSIVDVNGCGPIEASATIVSLGIPNGADAGPDAVVCSSDLPIQLAGSVINAPDGIWSGGAGTFLGSGLDAQYQPSSGEVASGTITLVLTTDGNTFCPAATDTVTYTLASGFAGLTTSATSLLCNGDGNGSIALVPQLPDHVYLWDDPAAQTTSTAVDLPGGTWSVTVTDAVGCDTTLTATVAEPLPIQVAIIPTHVTCNGMSTGSATAVVTGGTPVLVTVWSDGSTGDMVDGLDAGPITATVTDSNGCVASAGADITEPAAIVVTAQIPDTVCVNAPVLLSAEASGGSGDLLYTWNGMGTGDTLTTSFAQGQLVHLQVTDTAGCSGPIVSGPVAVLDLSTASLNTSDAATVCVGEYASVEAEVSGYPGTTTISWLGQPFSGNGPFTVQVFESDTIHVLATDACGNSLSGSIALDVDIPPVIPIGPVIAEGCAPFEVQFPDPSFGPGFTYYWDLGNGASSSAASPQLTYDEGLFNVSLVITTPLGCSSTVPMTGIVRAWPPPHADFTADPWTALANDGDIAFTDLSTDTITTWSWSFGDGTESDEADPTAHYDAAGTYPVELWVQDVHGCSDAIVRVITIDPVHEIGLPNAFTPDPSGSNGGIWIPGDLSNNVFYPLMDFVSEMQMRIYNRWGELIHESNDPSVGWDGYYKGSLCPQDVYAYQLMVRFKDDKVVVRTGDVTLLR